MAARCDDTYGTISEINGLMMPNVRFKWLPITYLRLLGVPKLVQAIRYFDNIDDALELLMFTLKQQEKGSETLYRDLSIARTIPYLYFRGLSRVEYGLHPTLYRDLPEDPREREMVLVDRMALSAAFFQKTAAHPKIERLIPGFKDMTIEKKRAIARHYGMPSDYMDLTRNPRVAAYFATHTFPLNWPMGPDPGADGAICMINLFHLSQIFDVTSHSDADGPVLSFHVPKPVARVPFLTIDDRNQVANAFIEIKGTVNDAPLFTFRWTAPGGVGRIAAQDAIFMRFGPALTALYDESTFAWRKAQDAWDLLDFLTFKFVFRQRRGYSSWLRGIRSPKLFPPDPVQDVADGILERHDAEWS